MTHPLTDDAPGAAAAERPQRTVYVNGEYVPESQAGISIFDSALMFGDMVFEMTRSYNRVQFKLREHLERLYASIKMLRIPLEMRIHEMERLVHEVIERNRPAIAEEDEERVMINVSRGPLSIYWPIFEGRVQPTAEETPVCGTHHTRNIIRPAPSIRQDLLIISLTIRNHGIPPVRPADC